MMALCTMLKLFTLTGFRLRIHCFPALTPMISAWTCTFIDILGMHDGNIARLRYRCPGSPAIDHAT